MHRNLDGSLPDRDQLIALAVEGGIPRESITRDMKTGIIADMSRKVRHEKWSRGEMLFGGGEPFVPTPPSHEVDWDVVAFLTRGKMTKETHG